MKTQITKNLSPKKYRQWQVQQIAGLSIHVKVGGGATFFLFRPKGHTRAFPFLFVGGGLGIGPQIGMGASGMAPTPHRFAFETIRNVGKMFYHVAVDRGPTPDFKWESLESAVDFVDIECEEAFSSCDLHRAFGKYSSASASLALGYGVGYITAFTTSRNLFTLQSTAGKNATISGSGGVALGASSNVGLWLAMFRG